MTNIVPIKPLTGNLKRSVSQGYTVKAPRKSTAVETIEQRLDRKAVEADAVAPVEPGLGTLTREERRKRLFG